MWNPSGSQAGLASPIHLEKMSDFRTLICFPYAVRSSSYPMTLVACLASEPEFWKSTGNSHNVLLPIFPFLLVFDRGITGKFGLLNMAMILDLCIPLVASIRRNNSQRGHAEFLALAWSKNNFGQAVIGIWAPRRA